MHISFAWCACAQLPIFTVCYLLACTCPRVYQHHYQLAALIVCVPMCTTTSFLQWSTHSTASSNLPYASALLCVGLLLLSPRPVAPGVQRAAAGAPGTPAGSGLRTAAGPGCHTPAHQCNVQHIKPCTMHTEKCSKRDLCRGVRCSSMTARHAMTLHLIKPAGSACSSVCR
jgi:hypothetical protein